MAEPRCDICPLREYWESKGAFSPVMGELNTSDTIVVGDAPGKQETIHGRPFVDSSSVEAMDAIKACGKQRHEIAWTNVCACRFPNDRANEFLARLKKRNSARRVKGKETIPSPMECCRPRLESELQGYSNIISFGSLATKAILPANPSLTAVRGGPTAHNGFKVLPTFHPSYASRAQIWSPIFQKDIAKAFRHFEGKLKWDDPKRIFTPSLDYLHAFIESCRNEKKLVAYDVETDALEPLTAGLRCIGLGTETEVLLVPFLSVDGESTFYPLEEEIKIRGLLAKFFVDPTICKVGHNAGYYDRIVIEQHFGVTPTPLIDTILLHRLAESEYPHGLGYIGSVLTDVPAWKATHTATTTSQDRELHDYCMTDVCVTARIVKPLSQQATRRKQKKLYNVDAQLQNICVGMHRLGMRIDEGRRQQHETHLRAELDHNIEQLRILLGDKAPNPNSPAQVQRLLFDKWYLPPHSYTDTGEPSANDAALRSLISNPIVEEEQKDVVRAIRGYRKASKLLNTYIKKLSPANTAVVQDGYVYPDYNVHGTISGRFSSSNPNFQNIPYKLRDMFIPPKGCVFVGADFDQLELRFASAVAGATHYLDAFEEREIDPHNLTGQMMFGDSFWQASGAPKAKIEKGKGAFKQLRDLAKTICFASLYGAAPPKVHELLTKAEDRDGKLLYGHYSLRQVRALHHKWMCAAPEFSSWWQDAVRNCRRDGYVEEVILNRRRYFVDLSDFNAIVNFGVQAGGFSVVALGMLKALQRIPFDFKNRTGLVNQLHDSVLFVVPEGRASWTREVVTDSLTQRLPQLPVTFTAEADIGECWSDV